MLVHTIIFLVRGSIIKTFNISRIVDDYCECELEDGYCFSDYEVDLLEGMRVDFNLFERVVNESDHEGLGYMVALYSLPYIEKRRGM